MFGLDKDKKPDLYQPESASRDIAARGVLIITGNKVEDLEFFYPYYRFTEAGCRVDVATPDGGQFAGKHGLELQSSKRLEDVKASDYAMLYLPGGKAPEELKKNEKAIALVKEFVQSGKPVAAICHGPQLLAKADVIRGRKIAAWPEVEGELREAGATYQNLETVRDGLFITARWPGDLPSHMREVLQVLQGAGREGARPAAAA